MLDASLHAVPNVPPERGAEWILLQPGVWIAPVPVEQALAAKTAGKAEAVHVEGNHGRWVVVCPDCRGAQLACPTDRRFMCVECANSVIGGLWRPVRWPKDHAGLGDLLDERPSRRHRNYEPGETVAQLRDQNRLLATGLILPDAPDGGLAAALSGPGVERASEFEGHAHVWPKRVKWGELYECPECGLTAIGHDIKAARESAA